VLRRSYLTSHILLENTCNWWTTMIQIGYINTSFVIINDFHISRQALQKGVGHRTSRAAKKIITNTSQKFFNFLHVYRTKILFKCLSDYYANQGVTFNNMVQINQKQNGIVIFILMRTRRKNWSGYKINISYVSINCMIPWWIITAESVLLVYTAILECSKLSALVLTVIDCSAGIP
jgi:hypothetical protein